MYFVLLLNKKKDYRSSRKKKLSPLYRKGGCGIGDTPAQLTKKKTTEVVAKKN